MRIFVTGASGFIGSAVVGELIQAGHRVLGLARSDASAQALVDAGAEAHHGSLDDLESLRAAAAATDGAIHCAFKHDDFSNMAAAGAADLRAVETIGAALAGSERPFVVTSATALIPSGQLATEDVAADSHGAGGYRAASEAATLALAEQGVRASVLRLPPSVHGAGDHGFVPFLVAIAREKGASAYVGDGENRWPAVHRLDAAVLYRLALEKGEAGSRFHAVADEGVPFREIAAAIGRGLSMPTVAKSPEDAAAHLGWLARFAAIDNPTSSAQTQEGLGWRPTGPTLLEDLDGQGRYFG